MKTKPGFIAVALAAATVLAAAASVHATPPTAARRCQAYLNKALAKFAQCRLWAESSYARTLDAENRGEVLARCSERLGIAFTKAADSWGASCPATESESEFDAFLTQCSDATSAATGGSAFPSGCPSVALPATGQTTCWDSSGAPVACTGTAQDGEIQAGSTLAYDVDDANGTITDLDTGLMWEKLSDDGSIHDRDNAYTWDQAFAKIATLNATSFAGHADWRVPNVKELQSLVNYENVDPAISLVFDAGCTSSCSVNTCSCTAPSPSFYWSSSTYRDLPSAAWYVDFGVGIVRQNGKIALYRVRAVRGGS